MHSRRHFQTKTDGADISQHVPRSIGINKLIKKNQNKVNNKMGTCFVENLCYLPERKLIEETHYSHYYYDQQLT